ncbi:thiamine pyrophosphate-dependent enzyme [Nonomuraea sp. MTCD27]|uniref:thiamine pyrophosphate-dependent enzyme n=1 Tax=Nonomuraea sp. MTCD27 TaxID=1676747 RepID=UPI0035BF6233
MPQHHGLEPPAPWVEVVATDEDWDAADPHLLTSMLGQLLLIRTFEEYVLDLARSGLVHGPAHSSIGQEGGAVGSVLSLAPGDTVNGSHRGHHQFLAKALAYVEPKGIDPTRDFSPEVREVLLRTLAEICGLDRGFSHGRGGSMHLRWEEAGAIGTNAIVGGGVPFAAGSAWAHRRAGTGAVAVTYFGDGAANIGSTLETLNLAAAWRLPLCFFVENNRYAVSTGVAEATAEPRLSARGPGFGVASWKVDGMDPLAVHLAMREVLGHLRAGRGPALVEADVYRYFHQNGPLPGSAFGYRTKEEEREWRARDPIERLAGHLSRRGLLGRPDVDAAAARARELMADVGGVLIEPVPGGRPGQRRIRPAEWPDPGFAHVGVRGDLAEFAGARTADRDTFTGELAERKFIDAVAKVMARRMRTDESIVVLGEDVHRLNGGTNGATRGLKESFPDRVLGTPISENAFTGLAGGIASDGRYTPVVELMYADFMWVAADQLFNQIAKARHMYGGDDAMPLVLRSKVAMGTGYGSQHSMDPAGLFATAPGWRIVAPTTPFDYVGLMNSALLCRDPVVVLEHVDLYNSTGECPVDDLDYCLPVGRAAVRRAGSRVTVLTYLAMTSYVLRAVEASGVDAEVIDLRWLDRASLDWETIGASVGKTRNVLIAEQGPVGPSYGGWLADELQRRFFGRLEQPVRRVTGGEASPSISKVLERAAIARDEEVAAALTEMTAHPSGREAGGEQHLCLRGTAQLDRLLKLRRRLGDGTGRPVSVTDFVIKAAAHAYRLVPAMNVARTPEGTRTFETVDLAVSADGGPVAPVLRSVERQSLTSVAAAVEELAGRARAGTLRSDELEGGVMTVTSLGPHDVAEVAATVGPARSAALAVGAVREEPVVRGGRVKAGPVLRVTLSVDRRAVDGAVAAAWMEAFLGLLADPVRVLG